MKSPILEPNKRAFWCKKKYRGEGRNIVDNDESYLHSSHTSLYGWYDRGDNCLLKAPIGKGQRSWCTVVVNKNLCPTHGLCSNPEACQVIITTI
jgi:hypothetical protein